MINVYSKSAVISYLKDNNIAPSKSRGQNFLIDENTAIKISNLSIKERSSYAFEIGGGLGSLTEKIIPFYNKNLSVVEYDKALYNHLIARYNDKIEIIHKNVLEVQLPENKNIDIYGNIPYNIASPILEWLFIKNYGKWNYAVMLVQDDFARRVTSNAGDKDYSALSMFSKFIVDSKIEFHISKNVFYPTPKIESSVISFKPKKIDKNILPIYRLLIKSLFHNRRKMAKNNISHSPYINKIETEEVDKMFRIIGIDKTIRGEMLEADIVSKMAYYIYENNLISL